MKWTSWDAAKPIYYDSRLGPYGFQIGQPLSSYSLPAHEYLAHELAQKCFFAPMGVCPMNAPQRFVGEGLTNYFSPDTRGVRSDNYVSCQQINSLIFNEEREDFTLEYLFGSYSLSSKYLYQVNMLNRTHFIPKIAADGKIYITRPGTVLIGDLVLCNNKPKTKTRLTWNDQMDHIFDKNGCSHLMRIDQISPTGILKCVLLNDATRVWNFLPEWVVPVLPTIELKEAADYQKLMQRLDPVNTRPHYTDGTHVEVKETSVAPLAWDSLTHQRVEHLQPDLNQEMCHEMELIREHVDEANQTIDGLNADFVRHREDIMDELSSLKKDLSLILEDEVSRTNHLLLSLRNEHDELQATVEKTFNQQVKERANETRDVNTQLSNLASDFDAFQQTLARYFLASPDERHLIHERIIENRRYQAIETCFKWGSGALVIISLFYYLVGV